MMGDFNIKEAKRCATRELLMDMIDKVSMMAGADRTHVYRLCNCLMLYAITHGVDVDDITQLVAYTDEKAKEYL